MKKRLLIVLLTLALVLQGNFTSTVAQRSGRIGGTTGTNIRPSSDQTSWKGTYIFQEGGGRSAGGTGMIVEHTITIYLRGSALIADIDAAGYQTSISLRCDARIEGNRISFYFNSYREDNVMASYNKGELLLALEKSTSSRKSKISTYWFAYKPVFAHAKNGRVYFRKTK